MVVRDQGIDTPESALLLKMHLAVTGHTKMDD